MCVCVRIYICVYIYNVPWKVEPDRDPSFERGEWEMHFAPPNPVGHPKSRY